MSYSPLRDGQPSTFRPDSLPIELLDSIFQTLTVDEKMKMSSLNHAWQEFMSQSAVIWRQLTFAANDHLTQAKFDFYCSRSDYQITRLHVAHPIDLLPVLKKCKSLIQLELSRSAAGPRLQECVLPQISKQSNLKILRIEDAVSLYNALNLLQECPNMEVADLSINDCECPHEWSPRISSRLEKLSLVADDPKFILTFPANLLGNAYRLRDLTIASAHTSIAAGLGHLSLRRVSLNQCVGLDSLLLPPSVEELYLRDRRRGGLLLSAISPLPKLRKLSIAAWKFVLDTCERLFLQIGNGLESLRLTQSLNMSNPAGSSESQSLSDDWFNSCVQRRQLLGLKFLKLTISDVTDETLRLLVSGCPTLMALDISYNCRITGTGIQHFIAHHCRMKILDASECSSIEPATMRWLESRGIALQPLP